MDTFTHVALGACVGELFFEKGFGKKAMAWGVLGQSLPDIDFVSNLFMDAPSAMLAHRGFTHSLFFLMLIVPILSLLAEKIHRPHNIRFKKWYFFFFTAIGIHLFIDAFNNYGIGWFEPFDHTRIAFNMIYVVDPIFFLFPFISFILLLILNSRHRFRNAVSLFGLILPFVYLAYCGVNKYLIYQKVSNEINERKLNYRSLYSTPAPLQSWLWFVVIVVPEGFETAYVSVFDDPKSLKIYHRRKNSDLLIGMDNHETMLKLIRFSEGYYTIEKRRESLIFNDLRFGQIQGWLDPRSDFVFHFDLGHFSAEDKLIIQRGRLKGWDFPGFYKYYRRISGK
jgi:inner membrane protein